MLVMFIALLVVFGSLIVTNALWYHAHKENTKLLEAYRVVTWKLTESTKGLIEIVNDTLDKQS